MFPITSGAHTKLMCMSETSCHIYSIVCFSYHNITRVVYLWCIFYPNEYHEHDTFRKISVNNSYQHDAHGDIAKTCWWISYILFEELHVCNWLFQPIYFQPRFVPSVIRFMFYKNITWCLDKSKWAMSFANICFPYFGISTYLSCP